MKTAIAALFLALIGPCLVVGDVVVRVLYKDEEEKPTCTPEELDFIFGEGRRKLRGHRELPCVKPVCKRRCCSCMDDVTCILIYEEDCSCRRRVKQEEQPELVSSPVAETDCDIEKARIEEMHQAAYDSLSATCKDHIEKRSLECYTVKRANAYGIVTGLSEIHGFNLLDAGTGQVVVEDLAQDSSFCRGGFEFSIEALAGIIVKKVTFVLTGPGDFETYKYTNDKRPFNMFAPSSGKKKVVEGALDPASAPLYPSGDYNLMVTPDDDATKAQFLKFTMGDC